MYRWTLLLAVALMVFVACAPSGSPGPKIKIENAWARPAATSITSHSGMPGSETTGAAYFTVINEGNEEDTIIGVTVDIAPSAEVHETRMQGDVAKMMPVPRVSVPARGRAEFKPLGLHVMMIGLTRDLKTGDAFSLTLQLEKSGKVNALASVREQ